MSIRTILRRALMAGLLVSAIAGAATAQTLPVKLLKGVVSDTKSGKPIDGGKLFVYGRNGGDPVAWSRINPSTGAFQVVLAPSEEYRFVVKSPRFVMSEFPVKTPPGGEYEEVPISLSVDPIPVGKVLYAGHPFDASASQLHEPADFDRAIQFLKNHPAAKVSIAIAVELQGASKPKAKPAPAARPSRKGKKGSATAQPFAELAVVEYPATTPDEAVRAQAKARQMAVRAVLQREMISLARVSWVMPQSVADVGRHETGKDNLTITISGIDVGLLEDE